MYNAVASKACCARGVIVGGRATIQRAYLLVGHVRPEVAPHKAVPHPVVLRIVRKQGTASQTIPASSVVGVGCNGTAVGRMADSMGRGTTFFTNAFRTA